MMIYLIRKFLQYNLCIEQNVDNEYKNNSNGQECSSKYLKVCGILGGPQLFQSPLCRLLQENGKSSGQNNRDNYLGAISFA